MPNGSAMAASGTAGPYPSRRLFFDRSSLLFFDTFERKLNRATAQRAGTQGIHGITEVFMNQRRNRMTGVAMAGMTALGSAIGLAAPASADVSACTVTPPPGQYGGTWATATCAAGAGTFTFRVVATCADAYPGPSLRYFTAYGPWIQASATSATTSSVPCYGYVPGSGFVWSASIQTQ